MLNNKEFAKNRNEKTCLILLCWQQKVFQQRKHFVFSFQKKVGKTSLPYPSILLWFWSLGWSVLWIKARFVSTFQLSPTTSNWNFTADVSFGVKRWQQYDDRLNEGKKLQIKQRFWFKNRFHLRWVNCHLKSNPKTFISVTFFPVVYIVNNYYKVDSMTSKFQKRFIGWSLKMTSF